MADYTNSKPRLYIEQRMLCYGCDAQFPYHKLDKPTKNKLWSVLVCEECETDYHYSSGSVPGCGHSVSG
jgi:ribosomal protein L44E